MIAWLRVVLLVGLVVFPAVTMFLLNWNGELETRWIYETRRRKVRAAELEAAAPRLLITGGSGGFFSLDAQLLTAKLGRPVLNLSTHGALGPRFFVLRAGSAEDGRWRGGGIRCCPILSMRSMGRSAGGMPETERHFVLT